MTPAMTPARLKHVMDGCFRRLRKTDRRAFLTDIAEFLDVSPATLRRWRSGETPIPRSVGIVMEVLHRWPEVTCEEVDEVIRQAVETSR